MINISKLNDKEWLEQKYVHEGLGAPTIAKLVGSHKTAVYHALKRHGIPSRPAFQKNPKLNDKEWLSEQYYKNYRSYTDIAEELGTTKHVVYRAFKKLELKGRTHTARYVELNNKEWLRKKYVDEKLSIKEIAQLVGCSYGAVGSSLIWSGVKLRNVKDALQNKYANGRWGEQASNWKGGRMQNGKDGHMLINKPDHPFATRHGYVMEHRLVMEQYLGRYLETEEVIHHVNGDKLDNLIDNLMLLPNRAVHARIHFEANKEIAYLKKMAIDGITDFEPYVYECLPKNFKDIHNPFDL